MSGSSLVTKGLVAPEDVTGESSSLAPNLPPGLATDALAASPIADALVIVTIPTAINTCLIAAENITSNLRARQASDLVLPSLYRRAFLTAYETDEIALVRR